MTDSDDDNRGIGAIGFELDDEEEDMATFESGFFKGHPVALPILFFSELWERFSFYGMRALLILYMLDGLKYTDGHAYAIYGAYGSLVYATPILGGILADRLLGNRAAILLGGTLMAMGHFIMAFPQETAFYTALALLILGNGLFKPNVSSMVGKLYRQGDPRRDAGFTIFYMGINLGAFLAPIACGLAKAYFGYHVGFGLAGVGMVIGLIWFYMGRGIFGERGAPPNPVIFQTALIGIVVSCAVAVPLVVRLMQIEWLREFLIPGIAATMFVYLFAVALVSPSVERNRLFALMILFFFSVVFWAFFEQAGSSLTVFTARNVNRLGIDPSIFQSVNALLIVMLAPLFSLLWVKLANSNKEPATPVKFTLALLQVGLGFLALVIGAKLAGGDAQVNVAFLLLAYFFHTTGELCISPVGLSTVTKLAPQRMVAFVMGFWFLSSSLAHFVAGKVAQGTSVGANATAVDSLNVYSGAFLHIAQVSLGAAIVGACLVPVIKHLMSGVK